VDHTTDLVDLLAVSCPLLLRILMSHVKASFQNPHESKDATIKATISMLILVLIIAVKSQALGFN
jgi:hypothetical protein